MMRRSALRRGRLVGRIAVMINKPDAWREGDPTDRIVVETDEPDANTLLLYVLGVIL